MPEEKTTGTLTSILKKAGPAALSDYLEGCSGELLGSRPFAAYMHALLAEKGWKQRDLFIAADIPEGYGYKLLSEEKHTQKRDLLIRLFLAAHMSLREAEKALKLAGMPGLYARQPRDAVFIIAFNRGLYEIAAVDELLTSNGLEPLQGCGAQE